ncbi:zinc finger protein 184-like isoform X2 [Salmo trutta]|uniref:zinc finger protein 184-like isoform X2 n=1 Tax=Salmo trutta TaxID=8032 RepID=UPI0011306DD4|nr:zinc finger protein 184-like isoform X2 [Salmo trutta]
MSKLQLLNVFLTKRLTAAAVEIYVEVEKTIIEYDNEISSSKEEIKRLRRLLDLVFNPEIKLHRADLHQLYLPDEVSPEQQHCEQEWSPSLKQEDPEPSQIKEEHEVWTSQGGEQLKELESDTKELIFTPSVENLEPPLTSHLFQMQIVVSPTSTTKEIKMKPCHIDLQQLSLPVSEEVPPKQHCGQEWSPSLGQEDPESKQIKEEHEEVWTSQRGEQLKGLESDTKEFIFTPTTAENQEPSQPSHFFQIQIVDSPTNIIEVMKTEPDGVCYSVSDKTLTCHICGKCFKCNWDFKRHIKTHTWEKPFRCNDCDKFYRQFGHLKRHMRKVHMAFHNREKPYRCHVCGKWFNWASSLKRHMRTHTGEKPYFCTECGKCYGHIGHLRVHMRNHTGERPYRCSLCKKGFTTSFQLKQHKNKTRSCGFAHNGLIESRP